MLVFGEIVAIKGHQAKLRLPQDDNYETDWFFIPQMCTVGDKSHNVYEIGTLVGAVTTENFDDGCIIGALYNDEDICVTEDKNIKQIVFSDGSFITYDKTSHNFSMEIKSGVNIKSPTTSIDGNLSVTGNITSTGQVADAKGSMQSMRDIYNGHTHGNGNNGANTSGPNEGMN